MIKPGDKVGIICCSNGQKRSCMTKIKYLEDTLLKMGIRSEERRVGKECL